MAMKMSFSQRTFSARSSVVSRPGRAHLHVVAAKGGEEGGKTFDKSCYGSLASNANYTLLASSLAKAGLDKVLMGAGPFTLFAPNDDAFADAARALKITKMELLALPNLPDILKYHAVAGLVMSSDMKEGQELTTVQGSKVKVSLAGGVQINGIKVKKADFKTSNGVVHVIDGVLIPK
ncbi:hypothetical protein CEUSTIGMA_g898.t1 [Chlamydomonas eustigma]|uniref:FAS1 domain-containing protein n=1 Tax=Chlamydomonas eustigma TaxID=1157962 RepID=A0A250WRW6_9CHLO|nr:hypothetical protein CEUSTIGMA_g898.t1 [Chlamydomonas eustigma]|eukprot:GAX73446.1 hypothetical protein CEUSTIGMA_g898.t1 [Chlamydomonas eustigma]